MKYLVSLTCLLSTMIASAVELNYQLIKSEYPTPAEVVTTKDYPNSCTLITGSVGNLTNCNAWTQIAWARCVSNQYDRMNGSSSSTFGSWFNRPWAIQFFSTRRGVGSTEGGPDLQPVPKCNWDYDRPLTLDADGQWAMTDLLPDCKDYDNGGLTNDVSWSYGCYAINITTDTDLTLTVGGFEKYVEAAAGKQSFSIKCETTDRSVTIAAASPDAVVKFGIAENPLVEFHGDQLDLMNSGGSTFKDETEGFCGFGTNEWIMIVSRARVNDDKSLTYQFGCMYYDCDHLGTKKTKVPNWKTEGPYFGPYSRIAVQCAAMYSVTNKSMSIYRHRIFNGWMDDERLSLIRDQDVREMKNIGIWAKRQSGFGWDFSINTTNSYRNVAGTYERATQEYVEPYTENKGLIHTAYVPPVNIIEVSLSSAEYTMDQIVWSCPGSTNFVNGKFYVPNNGTYQVSGLDPEGNTLTCSITCTQRTNDQWVSFESYGNTRLARWQKYTNDRVVNYMTATNATWIFRDHETQYGDPTRYFKRWHVRHIPCQPYKNCNSAQGLAIYGMSRPHNLSPHVWASATHYWNPGWGNPVETYISQDFSKTSVVQVCTGSRIALDKWALAHGFSSNEVAAAGCSDITVGTFYSDKYDGKIDEDMCPYYLDTDELKDFFPTNSTMSWVLGWRQYQGDMSWGLPIGYTWMSAGTTTGYATNLNYYAPFNSRGCWMYDQYYPSNCTSHVTLNDDDSRWKYISLSLSGTVAPEISAKLKAMEAKLSTTEYPGFEFGGYYTGDSGLANYVEPEPGIWVINFQNTSIGGPNYHRCLKILEAYCKAQGDELKIYHFPEEPPSE